MKLAFSLILICCFYTAAHSQKCTINGNVFYKYNDLIGNRPDAGASVIAVNLANQQRISSIIADVQGNYKITNLDSGVYLIIVKSKINKANPYHSFSQLKIFSAYLERAVGIKIKESNPALEEEIEKLHSEFDKYLQSQKTKSKTIYEYRKTLNNKVFDFYNNLPSEMILLGINLPTEKVDFQIVEFKAAEEKNIVTDFGLTYF